MDFITLGMHYRVIFSRVISFLHSALSFYSPVDVTLVPDSGFYLLILSLVSDCGVCLLLLSLVHKICMYVWYDDHTYSKSMD